MNHQRNRVDSDEEPPAAALDGTSARRDLIPLSTALRTEDTVGTPHAESHALDELGRSLQARYAAMTSLPPCVPAVVSFCVGRRSFAVSRALIEKDPGSLLFLLTVEHYTPSLKSSLAPLEGKMAEVPAAGRKRVRSNDTEERALPVAALRAIELPERSPELFAMLLNILRGYRNAILPEWRESCKEEAVYYGLTKSWRARFNELPEPYYFRNPLHNSKIVGESVLGVASEFLTSGEHHIDFSIVQLDKVGVGVISTTTGTLAELGPQAQDGNGGAFYWNDGKLSFYMGEPRILETGFPFPTGAVVRVVFDADERIIRWIGNGEYCVAMERLPAGRQYAFSTIASRNSQVTIVQP